MAKVTRAGVTVVHAFEEYRIGDRIFDKEIMDKVLKERPNSVVAINHTYDDGVVAEKKEAPTEPPSSLSATPKFSAP